MRKLFLLTAVAVLASCQARLSVEPTTATAFVDYGFGSSITKSVADDVRNGAALNLPEDWRVKVAFYVDRKQVSQTVVGESITLPVGELRANLYYTPEPKQFSDYIFFNNEPTFIADSTFFFHSYTKHVHLKARYQCALIVTDTTQVFGVSYLCNGRDTFIDTFAFGKYKAFYVTQDNTTARLDLNVIALEKTDYRNRKVSIGGLEYGKFYTLSPEGITEGSSDFAFDVLDFENGGEL